MTGASAKQQCVENAVKGLDFEEMKARWLDEIVARVRVSESSNQEYQSDATTFEDDSSTQRSDSSTETAGRYQATVEDDTSSEPDVSTDTGAGASGDDGRGVGEAVDEATQENTSEHASLSVSQVSLSSSSSSTSTSYRHCKPSPPPNATPNTTPAQTTTTPSPPPSPTSQSPKPRPTVHFSGRPIVLRNRTADLPPSSQVSVRPSMAERASTELGLSVVDLKWGRLFTEGGEPTRRLGEVLKGVAEFLIGSCGLTDSLGVTPEKLHAFYTKYALKSEVFAFTQIFNPTSRNLRHLEFLYQDLQAPYHLTQDPQAPRPYTSRPHIPGLTPSGFAQWMTLLILAFPNREAARLNRVLADLPIQAEGFAVEGAGNGKGKVPCQISPYFFPSRRCDKVFARVVECFDVWERGAVVAELVAPGREQGYSRLVEGKGSGERDRKEERVRYGASADRDASNEVSRYQPQQRSRDHPKSSRSIYRTTSDRSTDRLVRSSNSNSISPRPHRHRSPHGSKRHQDDNKPNTNTSSHRHTSHRPPSTSTPTSREHSPGDRRSRRAENYRFFQGRERRGSLESAMGLGGKRRGESSATYDEYVRGPRSSTHTG